MPSWTSSPKFPTTYPANSFPISYCHWTFCRAPHLTWADLLSKPVLPWTPCPSPGPDPFVPPREYKELPLCSPPPWPAEGWKFSSLLVSSNFICFWVRKLRFVSFTGFSLPPESLGFMLGRCTVKICRVQACISQGGKIVTAASHRAQSLKCSDPF